MEMAQKLIYLSIDALLVHVNAAVYVVSLYRYEKCNA